MDRIYSLTTIYPKGLPILSYRGDPIQIDDTRCVGVYTSKENAHKSVINNNGDMYEYRYRYAVIEEIQLDVIYPFAKITWWYEWIDGAYQPIDTPEQYEKITNFGIG